MNKFGLPDGLLDTVKTVLEKMDPVDKNALGKTFAKRKDKDIDNDGDIDNSDKYLHRRRKAVKKAMGEVNKKDKVILNPKDDEKQDVKESSKVNAVVKELSKATKTSYVQKATTDLFKKGSDMSTAVSRGDSDAADKATKKATKRAHNIQTLIHKGLYNKEEKLDELSPETLKKYKAAVDKKHTVKDYDPSKGVNRYTSTGKVQRFKDSDQEKKRDTGVARANDRLKKEDVQRDVDFKMVKVRLPDGRRVWRKVRKSMKVGGVKGQDNLHKAFYDEKDPVQESKQQDEIVGTLARGVGKVVGGAAKLATKGAIGTAKLAGKGIAKGVGAAARSVSTAGRADRAAQKALALKKAVANQRAKNMARAKLDREKANIDKYKAQLQKAKGNVPTQQKAPVPGTTENTKVKSGLENPHNCATHVYSEQWGEGRTISTMHADPDAFGNVSWYDVMFEHGIEKEVQTKDLKIIKEKNHGHLLNKKEKK